MLPQSEDSEDSSDEYADDDSYDSYVDASSVDDVVLNTLVDEDVVLLDEEDGVSSVEAGA